MGTQDDYVSVVNTDGGSRGNPGPAAWGFVMESPFGRHAASGYIGTETNNVAEYRALVEALKFALSLKLSKLLVRCDSKLIVEQMNKNWRVKHEDMKPLWAEATLLSEEFSLFNIIHVRREFNKEADAEVNRCLDAVGTQGKL